MSIYMHACMFAGVRLEGLSVYRALQNGKIKTNKAQSHAISASLNLNLQACPRQHEIYHSSCSPSLKPPNYRGRLFLVSLARAESRAIGLAWQPAGAPRPDIHPQTLHMRSCWAHPPP